MIAEIISSQNPNLVIRPSIWDDNFQSGRILNISLQKPQRTLDQNALYWKFVGFCCKKMQLTPEQLHEYFKYNILPEIKLVELPNKTFTIRTSGSTKDLTATEFSDYFEQANAMMIEYGVDTAEFWSQYDGVKR